MDKNIGRTRLSLDWMSGCVHMFTRTRGSLVALTTGVCLCRTNPSTTRRRRPWKGPSSAHVAPSNNEVTKVQNPPSLLPPRAPWQSLDFHESAGRRRHRADHRHARPATSAGRVLEWEGDKGFENKNTGTCEMSLRPRTGRINIKETGRRPPHLRVFAGPDPVARGQNPNHSENIGL